MKGLVPTLAAGCKTGPRSSGEAEEATVVRIYTPPPPLPPEGQEPRPSAWWSLSKRLKGDKRADQGEVPCLVVRGVNRERIFFNTMESLKGFLQDVAHSHGLFVNSDSLSHIEMSCETINRFGHVSAIVIPKARTMDDESVQAFSKKLRHAFSDWDSPRSRQNTSAHEISFLKPPLDLDAGPHIPSLGIHINEPPENVDLDRLSSVVKKMNESNQSNALLNSPMAPMWLSRLDPSALQRYITELTEGLIGSVEAAFATDNTLPDDDD